MSILVHYFGGYCSTQDNIDAWVNSAAKKMPDVMFQGYPYPKNASAGTAGNPLAVWSDSDLIAEEIEATQRDYFHYLVGHSSGCAIANDVASHALMMNASNWYLIALDGFRPNVKLQATKRVACWSARCGRFRSRNYDAMQECTNFKVFEAAEDCTLTWPLHFSLVNLSINDAHASITDGYYNCDANLKVVF